jgi:hypothetical protein
MSNPADGNHPVPSLPQLRRATVAAALVGTALVVTTVLPAEYGIDPTGIGRVLGLTPMGEMKRALDAPARQGHFFSLIGSAYAQTAAPRNDEVTLTLKPGESAEVKAFMKVGDEMTWRWSTMGGRLNFEFHGERPNAPPNEFTSYGKGTGDKAEGTFKPKFDGTHGWFWRNRNSQPITVTVNTNGRYEKLEKVK